MTSLRTSLRANLTRRRILGGILLAYSGSLLVRFGGCDVPQVAPELERFTDCDQLEAFIEDQAVAELTFTEPSHPSIPTPLFLMLGCADGVGGGLELGDTEGGGDEYSTTNLQELGVDEADFVKNDGEFLYIVHGSDLVIVDAWLPEDMREISRTPIQGYPVASYLTGDTVAVLSFLVDDLYPASGDVATMRGAVVKVTVLDVGDREAPRLVHEVYAEGELVDSRRIEDRLYLVTYRDLIDPLRPVGGSDEEIETEVRALSVDDWMPRRAVSRRLTDRGWSFDVDRQCDCEDVYRPARAGGLGMTSVLSIDLLDHDADVAGTSILAGRSQVYASTESLYLAVTEPKDGPNRVGLTEQGTRLHKFDLTGAPARPAYVASGRVDGTIGGSFAMDEADGRLRIATSRWQADGDRVNGLYILADHGEGALDQIAAVTDIAETEEIYAVRFFDDVAYLVTFPVESAENSWSDVPSISSLVDPLFAIDLTVPEAPVVVGELEITGYSTYLHPLDEDHLIGVGEEIDPDTGAIEGLAVSLFDVTDLGDPRLQDRVVLETGWDSSEALFDHHAFLYYEPLSMLTLPVLQSEGADGPIVDSTLEVFRVTATDGIQAVGSLDAAPLMDERIDPDYHPYCSQVRRAVVIEDVLYGVAAGGVIASDVDDLDDPLAILQFPDHGYCDQPWEDMDIIW